MLKAVGEEPCAVAADEDAQHQVGEFGVMEPVLTLIARYHDQHANADDFSAECLNIIPPYMRPAFVEGRYHLLTAARQILEQLLALMPAMQFYNPAEGMMAGTRLLPNDQLLMHAIHMVINLHVV